MAVDDRANIVFSRLCDVDKAALIELMNHRLVRRHMPLARGSFGPEEDRHQQVVAD